MSVNGYTDLLEHTGHEIKCVRYGDPDNPENVAIECETCSEVLLDYDRPSRFVVVAKFRDNPASDYLGLIPITIPADDMIEGANAALLAIDTKASTRRERWRILTIAGDPVFFPEEFAAFEALWALASNPEACQSLMIIAKQFVTHLDKLDDEQLTIMEDEPIVANYLNQLRDTVEALEP